MKIVIGCDPNAQKEKEELITLFENPEEAPDASEESVAGEEPVIEEVE